MLCAKLDPDCASPIVSGIYDINGDIAFEVPTGGLQGKGFDGFLHLKMPAALCTDEVTFGVGAGRVCSLAPGCDPMHPDDACLVPIYPDAYLFFNPPVTNDMLNPITVPLVASAALGGLQVASGSRMADRSTGIVFATVLDCTGVPAVGATIDYAERTPADVPASTLYLLQGALSPMGPTDSTGLAGIIAVPAGYKQIVARRANATGIETGSAGVNIKPLGFTYVSIVLSAAN